MSFCLSTILALVQTYLNVVEIVVSAVLIVMLIAQSRGSGFTGTSQDQTTVFRTRRGIEKTLFQATLVLATLFLVAAIASSLIGRL
jgi:preprotein translocase subunit SecG